MMIFLRVGVLVLVMYSLALMTFGREEHSVHPDAGFVPDEATATRIAEAILIPIYGQIQVEAERPFSAKLTGSVWKVTGHLPPGVDGGVAEAWIEKRDGRILRVTHGK